MDISSADRSAFNFDDLELKNPLWDFSLQLWQNEAFQSALLALQATQSLRINNVLLAVWASDSGLSVRDYYETLDSSATEWFERVVLPLRQARQAIPKTESLKKLRCDIQQNELKAEQIELGMIYRRFTELMKSTDQGAESHPMDTLLNNMILSGVDRNDLLLLVQALFSGSAIERSRFGAPQSDQIEESVRAFLNA